MSRIHLSEVVALAFPSLPQGDDSRYRPTISVTAAAYGQARVLLDSGSDSIVLLQWGGTLMGYGNPVRITTVNGSIACKAANYWLRLGKKLVSDRTVLNCQSVLLKPSDREGILPTTIFKQLFISHAGSYVIIEPTKLIDVPQEIAVVRPSLH